VTALETLRAILGVAAVLLGPGLAWTFAWRKPLAPLERLALAFGLSLAMVPAAAIAWSRWLGLPLSTAGGLALVALLIASGAATAWLRRRPAR
jgi:uncharacterized membrane protein